MLVINMFISRFISDLDQQCTAMVPLLFASVIFVKVMLCVSLFRCTNKLSPEANTKAQYDFICPNSIREYDILNIMLVVPNSI